nr:hypothetical protein [Tanacetum cinerariifolium]
MPPKFEPLTQAAIRRMIKENVDAAIAAERARHANVGNDSNGPGPVRGQDAAPAARKCTFAWFMKCNPTAFCGTKGAVELLRWFEKTKSIFGIIKCVEGKKVRTIAMKKLIEKLGNAEGKVERKKLKKELEEARGFVLEERPNEAIDVLVKDEERTQIKS